MSIVLTQHQGHLAEAMRRLHVVIQHIDASMVGVSGEWSVESIEAIELCQDAIASCQEAHAILVEQFQETE